MKKDSALPGQLIEVSEDVLHWSIFHTQWPNKEEGKP
jgi:hypothetical protein